MNNLTDMTKEELIRLVRSLQYDKRKLEQELKEARRELRSLPDSEASKAIDYIIRELSEAS